MKKLFSFFAFLFLLLSSCNNLPSSGVINFVLDEGASFVDENFSTTFISGESNTIIINGLPRAKKEGYFFVGWREYVNGSYSMIQTRVVTDSSSPFFGQNVYYYPYGSTTLYSYFEPLETFVFDLNVDESLNPVLIEPKEEKENFSLSSASLFGYEKKSISSKDCLPTASCTDKIFSHWAIEYPLVSYVDEVSNRTYFSIDYSAEKGLYSFLDFFASAESISFPQIPLQDKSITLYAIWIDDPLITIDIGFANLTTSFRAKNRVISDDIFSAIVNSLKDYGGVIREENNIYFNDYEYKFVGCFLDKTYSIEFPITFPISESSLTLYVLWGKKINVTFDYNGGLLNDQTSETFSCYGYDFLPTPSSYPSNQNGFFNYYTFNDEKIYFDTFRLPNEDITFVAHYDALPLITLSYSFPNNFSYNTGVFRSREYLLPAGSNISTVLDSFSSRLSELTEYKNNMLENEGFYFEKDNNEYLFNSSVVPQESLFLKLKISYTSKITVFTINDFVNIPEIDLGYLNSSQTNISLLSLSSTLKNDLVLDSNTYIFDGFYFDEELSHLNNLEIISGSSSTESAPIIKVYRKMVKGIKLTFTGVKSGSCYVIPSSTLEDNFSRIMSALKVNSLSSYKFTINQDGVNYEISSLLPSVDSTIIVSKK